LSLLIWDAFLFVQGPLLALVAIALGILTPLLKPDAVVSIGWFIAVAAVALIACIVLFQAARSAFGRAQRPYPAIRRSMEPQAGYTCVRLLILDPSDLYFSESMVSILRKEDDLEVLIALGAVFNVQENGIVQVGVLKYITEDEELIARIDANDAQSLRNLIVKPSVPYQWWSP
jgi:hypothetical protein